jgi:hypothetical protein
MLICEPKRIVLLLTLVCACSCGTMLAPTVVYSSKSPDGKSEVRVETYGCFADCSVDVRVKHGWRSVVIASRKDCWFEFAHANWIGSRVAIFVDNRICGSIEAAFDTESNLKLEFAPLEDKLRRSIVESYAVSPAELKSFNGDVFSWARDDVSGVSSRSRSEFKKRFPDR